MNIKVAITFSTIPDSTYIDIEQIENTNNYKFLVETVEGSHYDEFGGVIYNHESDYLKLVEKILNGRNLS